MFGKVMEGTYTPQNGPPVPCALKKLKTDETSNHKTEILREADAMAALEHANIVRLLGMCLFVHVLCVSVCVSVCVCVSLCVHVCEVHIYVWVSVCMYVYMYHCIVCDAYVCIYAGGDIDVLASTVYILHHKSLRKI